MRIWVTIITFALLGATGLVLKAPIEQVRNDWRAEHCGKPQWKFYCGEK